MSWTILLSGEKDCELCTLVYSRALMVHEVEHINDALANIEYYIRLLASKLLLRKRRTLRIRLLRKALPVVLK